MDNIIPDGSDPSISLVDHPDVGDPEISTSIEHTLRMQEQERLDREKPKRQKERAIDQIQACIILAGGQKLSEQEIKSMTVNDLLHTCFNNGISIAIRPAQRPEDKYWI